MNNFYLFRFIGNWIIVPFIVKELCKSIKIKNVAIRFNTFNSLFQHVLSQELLIMSPKIIRKKVYILTKIYDIKCLKTMKVQF